MDIVVAPSPVGSGLWVEKNFGNVGEGSTRKARQRHASDIEAELQPRALVKPHQGLGENHTLVKISDLK